MRRLRQRGAHIRPFPRSQKGVQPRRLRHLREHADRAATSHSQWTDVGVVAAEAAAEHAAAQVRQPREAGRWVAAELKWAGVHFHQSRCCSSVSRPSVYIEPGDSVKFFVLHCLWVHVR